MASPPKVTESLALPITYPVGRSIQNYRFGWVWQVHRAKLIKGPEELIGFDNGICAENHPGCNPLPRWGLESLNPHNLSKAKDGPARLSGKRR